MCGAGSDSGACLVVMSKGTRWSQQSYKVRCRMHAALVRAPAACLERCTITGHESAALFFLLIMLPSPCVSHLRRRHPDCMHSRLHVLAVSMFNAAAALLRV